MRDTVLSTGLWVALRECPPHPSQIWPANMWALYRTIQAYGLRDQDGDDPQRRTQLEAERTHVLEAVGLADDDAPATDFGDFDELFSALRTSPGPQGRSTLYGLVKM